MGNDDGRDAVPLVSPDGTATAAVDSTSGGRLTSLVIDGHEVMATCEAPYEADYFRGSFPMAPWCGILPDGVVSYEGETYRVSGQSSAGGPPHYHGAIHSWPMQIVQQEPDQVVQEVLIGPGEPDDWPWPGLVRHAYRLTNDTLVATLSVHTSGPEFPAGAGFHPWFVSNLGDDPSRPADVDFRPGRELIHDDASWRVPGPVGDDLGSGVFIEVASPPRISWPNGPSLELLSSAPVWVTYDRTPGGFCVEPWTTPDGPIDPSYAHRVTPTSPLVLEFVIKFRGE